MGEKSESSVADALAKAADQLAAAQTAEDVAPVVRRVLRLYRRVQSGRFSPEIKLQEATLRLRAERKLGLCLAEARLAHGAPGNQYTGKLDRFQEEPVHFLLADLKIDKKISFRAQHLAAMPGGVLEAYFVNCKREKRSPSYNGALALAEPYHRALRAAEGKAGEEAAAVPILTPLIEKGERFATIFATPPWPRSRTPLRPMRALMKRLVREPVRLVAAENCQLHLWTESRFLPEAVDLLRAWGFAYASHRVYGRKAQREWKYWNYEQRLLILGVRGEPTFAGRELGGYVDCDDDHRLLRIESIVELIERVSPGPYLELFGKNWSRRAEWKSCDGR